MIAEVPDRGMPVNWTDVEGEIFGADWLSNDKRYQRIAVLMIGGMISSRCLP
jgi:hypothetical protein